MLGKHWLEQTGLGTRAVVWRMILILLYYDCDGILQYGSVGKNLLDVEVLLFCCLPAVNPLQWGLLPCKCGQLNITIKILSSTTSSKYPNSL